MLDGPTSDRDIATHDMHQAERMADRVAVAPAERAFDDPTDERTAKFVSGELGY